MDERNEKQVQEDAQQIAPEGSTAKRRGVRAFLARWFPTLGLLARLRSPIFMKEMRSAFRRRRFFVAHTITVSLIGVVILVSAFYYAEETKYSSAEVGAKLFYNFVFIQLLLTCLVYPAFGCTSITDERANKSFDLLVTSNLQPWEIVYGKCIATFVYSSVFILTTIPFVWLSMLFGAITPGMIALTYFFLILFSIVITLLSVFISSLFENSAKAVITTYGAVLFAALALYYYFTGDSPTAEAASGTQTAAAGGVLSGAVGVVEKFRGWFSEVKTYDRPYLFAYAIYFFFVFCAFFFILASNRLKPPAYNRSTSMKIFLVATTVLMLALGFDHFSASFTARSVPMLEAARNMESYPLKKQIPNIEDRNLIEKLKVEPDKVELIKLVWLKNTWRDGKWNGPGGESKPYDRKNWEKYRLGDDKNICPNLPRSWKNVEKCFTKTAGMLPMLRQWGLEMSRFAATIAFLFCFVIVLFFSGEPLVPSLRIRTKISKLAGWKKVLLPLAPGAKNGVVFSLALSAFVLVAVSVFFLLRSGLYALDYSTPEYRGWYSSLYFPVVFWIFLFFVSQLTLFLTTGRSGPAYGKIFAFFIVLVLTLAPVLPWAARASASWWTGYCLSPIFMASSLWTLPSPGSDVQLVTGGAATFIWSMLLYSALSFTLAVINHGRTARRGRSGERARPRARRPILRRAAAAAPGAEKP